MTGRSLPWLAGAAGEDAKRHAPATARNREPILETLGSVLPARGTMLEIASGSGEHAVHFAGAFPDLVWQPSDPDPQCRASIDAWAAQSGFANILPALDLDAASYDWPIGRADAVLCINMIHISPWRATEGLFEGAAGLLPVGAPLYLYGPFLRSDAETAPSNLAFDRSLRDRNPDWGLRERDEVRESAAARGFAFDRLVEMPANNIAVVFRKRPDR